MRQKIDVAALVREALEVLPETVDGYPPSPAGLAAAASAQPTTLDDALADPLDEGDRPAV
ncbi:MAG: hypothetical protein ACRYHQ_22015 [Janthinobacterium lividum]